MFRTFFPLIFFVKHTIQSIKLDFISLKSGAKQMECLEIFGNFQKRKYEHESSVSAIFF